MKKKTWMLGTLLVIASATVMVGCGGQTSNTTENSANATSNASTNNSSGENNATASDTFTFTLSISNKTTDPNCELDAATLISTKPGSLSVINRADPPRLEASTLDTAATVEANAFKSMLINTVPVADSPSTMPISSDPEILTKPREQPDGVAQVNFTVAGVAGEANAPEVLAETYNVNVTDGTITFESYDPGAGVMKGTFIGKADCRKGSNDTVEIDMSAAFELKPE
jgi:hypothetical protein